MSKIKYKLHGENLALRTFVRFSYADIETLSMALNRTMTSLFNYVKRCESLTNWVDKLLRALTRKCYACQMFTERLLKKYLMVFVLDIPNTRDFARHRIKRLKAFRKSKRITLKILNLSKEHRHTDQTNTCSKVETYIYIYIYSP